MKILIIDNHVVSLRGIENLVATEFTNVQVFSARTCEQGVRILENEGIELVIAELYYPHKNFVETYNFLKRIEVPVIVHTLLEIHGVIKVLLKSIVNESLIISKTQPIEDLLNAIRCFSLENTGETVSNYVKTKKRAISFSLTHKERALLISILAGDQLSVVATDNKIDYSSVKAFKKKILKKFKTNKISDLFQILQLYEQRN